MPLRRRPRRPSYAQTAAGRRARLSAQVAVALCAAQGRARPTLDDLELADRVAEALLGR